MPNEFSEQATVAATSAIAATVADTIGAAFTTGAAGGGTGTATAIAAADTRGIPDVPRAVAATSVTPAAGAVAAIEKVRASLPQPKDVRELAEFFRIVGNEMRIKILLSLSGERLRVCDIAAVVETSVSATSHQLGMLRQAHLVKYDKVGKVVYYSLDDAHIEAVFASAIEHVTEK